MGLKRNLSVGEILEQLLIVNKNIKHKVTNIVFMGMGEPFLNYNNVIKASQILSNPKGFNLSTKRITISTAGILPKIEKYILEKHKYKLAISLNASNDVTRKKIMPINKKWDIDLGWFPNYVGLINENLIFLDNENNTSLSGPLICNAILLESEGPRNIFVTRANTSG